SRPIDGRDGRPDHAGGLRQVTVFASRRSPPLDARKGSAMSILVAYASKHGATEGIARRIADTLRREGYPTTVSALEHAGNLAAYEAIILGSAVYCGSWLKKAVEYIHHNRLALTLRP